MAQLQFVKGVDKVVRTMHSCHRKADRGAERGLKRAGMLLQRMSMEICPVQTGDLRDSAETRWDGAGTKTVVRVVYKTDYAVYVHEDLTKAHGAAFNRKYARLIATRGRRLHKSKKGRFTKITARQQLRDKKGRFTGRTSTDVIKDPYFMRGEQQQAKFLEKPARENRGELIAVVRDAFAEEFRK